MTAPGLRALLRVSAHDASEPAPDWRVAGRCVGWSNWRVFKLERKGEVARLDSYQWRAPALSVLRPRPADRAELAAGCTS